MLLLIFCYVYFSTPILKIQNCLLVFNKLKSLSFVFIYWSVNMKTKTLYSQNANS